VTAIPGLSAAIPEDAWDHVDCGLCGGAERRLQFEEGPFSVVTCTACGLTYVTPRLKDASLLDQVYDEAYWASNCASERGYSDYRTAAPLYLRTYRRRLRVVRRHFPQPGRVLDVGCAAGYFLDVMRGEGWDVLGLEPSAAIFPQTVERLGEDHARLGLLGEVELEAGSFDLITMWDVIEHIPDPVAAVREVGRLLKPGGKFLIETQNVSSTTARVLGRRWHHYKHAEHIYHFDPKTLADMLDRAEFEILENRPWLGGKYVSMGFIAERARRLHPAVAWVLSPLKLLANRSIYVNMFDEMIVVARPR
jgi:2-polyprenyl-3-methyl-5-hydroxy-6-metoxy-1,4-benzoquinol methylase